MFLYILYHLRTVHQKGINIEFHDFSDQILILSDQILILSEQYKEIQWRLYVDVKRMSQNNVISALHAQCLHVHED